MKIALLTDGIYPDFVGGMQKHSFYLAKYLARNGVDVDLYLRDSDSKAVSQLVQFTDEERHRIGFYYILYPGSSYFPGHYLWQSYCYSSLLYEKLKKNLSVDFLYAQGFTGWKLLNEKRNGVPIPTVGVNFHGFEMFQTAPSAKVKLQQWMLRPFVRSILKKSDIAFSLGGKLDEFIMAAGVPQNRIFHSPNGIDSSWLVPSVKEPGERRRFVFIGRYERRKGIEELSRVLTELLPSHSFDFDFVGPILETLQIKAPNIKYWGLVKDGEKMQGILRASDILVCPSHSEGMPTVILEAMASGLAVIASDVGAVSSMVSAVNGWLIQPGDKGILKEAMIEAITLPNSKLHEKKINSLASVKNNFTWDKVINLTISEIEKGIHQCRFL